MRVIRAKKVLVTGAARGIGRALALRLAQEGAQLYLLDIAPESLAATVEDARRFGGRVTGKVCDLADSAQLSDAVREMFETWGPLDILVNNAGLAYYGPTVKMRSDQWERLLATNVQAPVQLVRLLLPMLLERPESHILNVASMFGFLATGRCAAYHLSKFALVGFSEALRAEFHCKGLGVSVLCPSFASTELYRSLPGDPRRPLRQPPWWLCTTAERIAEKAVSAIYRNRRLVLVGLPAYLAYYTRRIAPGLIDAIYGLGRYKRFRQMYALLRQRTRSSSPIPPHLPSDRRPKASHRILSS